MTKQILMMYIYHSFEHTLTVLTPNRLSIKIDYPLNGILAQTLGLKVTNTICYARLNFLFL